jgi:hypothetical protein
MLAAAALLVGCGGDDEPATTVPVVGGAPTTPTQASTTPTTPATPTTPTSATATTPAQPRDPITVKGARGDALTLVGQPSYQKPSKVKVKVTLTRVTGPFSGFNLDAGHQLIGIELRIENVGEAVYDDPQPGGRLAVTGGESGKQTSLISGSNKNPCDNPSLKLKPGQSKTVCVAYDIPKNDKPATFEFGVDSGFGDTGLWRLR